MATIWGIILWVLIFVVVTVMMFGFPGLYQNWMALIANPFLIIFCAWMYFKGVKGTVKDGIILGIYWIILGTILDLLVTIPLFVKNYSFLFQWTLWLGWLETAIFPAITVKYLKK
jgi:hypothetical protein